MSVSSALQIEVEMFLKIYGAGVGRRDARFLASQYAYPAHITSDSGTVALVAVTSKRDCMRKLEEILFTYDRMGFESLTVLGLTVTELSPLLAHARVHWALNDVAGNLIYDFEMTYTLARFESGLLITSVIVHNEIPQYRVDTLVGGFPRALAS